MRISLRNNRASTCAALWLQGNCTGVARPHFTAHHDSQTPSQCAILLKGGQQLFAWPQGLPGPQPVWMDGLYVRCAGDTSGDGVFSFAL